MSKIINSILNYTTLKILKLAIIEIEIEMMEIIQLFNI